MIEDEIYRTSSQYRHWSYTHEALATLRQKTNEHASDRVRAAIRRSRSNKVSQNGVGNGVGHHMQAEDHDTTVETLTVQEELKIVRWGCSKIIDMGQVMEPPIPMEIRVCSLFLLSSLADICEAKAY